MKMIKNKKWFTLVELIVVITILAILGSIAFVSLQGYSADTRNSKRVSDLSSISSKVNIVNANGTAIINIVTPVAVNKATAPNIAWLEDASSFHDAGTVNFTILWMKGEEFKDSNGDNYLVWATSKVGWVYELAASMETEDSEEAYILGTYKPRVTGSTVDWTLSGDIFTVTDWFWILKKWDTVSGTSWTATIKSISKDLAKIVFDSGHTLAWTTINISFDEDAWLITSTPSTPSLVVNGGTVLPY